MRPGAAVLVAALTSWAATVAGCADDIGERCPQMRTVTAGSSAGEDAGGAHVARSEYQVAVETRALFPCESSTCVATPGRDPYCSRACESRDDCPEAFVCRALIEIGPGAGTKHCVWRE